MPTSGTFVYYPAFSIADEKVAKAEFCRVAIFVYPTTQTAIPCFDHCLQAQAAGESERWANYRGHPRTA